MPGAVLLPSSPMAFRAGRRARLAQLVGRGLGASLACGAAGRQARIVGGHVADIGFAHALGDHFQRRMRALAFLVCLQRAEQVALALRGEVRNARRDAAAVQAMAFLAVGVGKDFAGLDVARTLQRLPALWLRPWRGGCSRSPQAASAIAQARLTRSLHRSSRSRHHPTSARSRALRSVTAAGGRAKSTSGTSTRPT